MSGPWTVLGPAVASQTRDGIRRRYQQSVLLVLGLLGGFLAVAVLVGEPNPYFRSALEVLQGWIGTKGWPPWVGRLAGLLLPCMFLLILVQLVPAVLVWWELKVAAHIQVRLGPMRVGRWHGWAQTIADGIKLLLKEDIVPAGADRWVHFLAPIVVLAPAFVCYAPIPFGQGLVAANLDVGVLFVLAVSGLSVIGLMMAGWGSNNKYSVLGGLRAAAQLVSYEIPRVVSVLPIVMWAGTMSLVGIVNAQAGLWGGFLPKWFVFYFPIGPISFLIYIICSVAETNRAPFDMAEAESELVAGVHTEYSGMKFAIFFMAEYAYVFLGSALGAVLFLGGDGPLPFFEWIPSYVWFFGKTFFLVFLFFWVRWTYPRLRVDRLMEFCWKFLLPWSLVNVVVAGLIFQWRWGG